jgi:type IV pilus assembly protein PilE
MKKRHTTKHRSLKHGHVKRRNVNSRSVESRSVESRNAKSRSTGHHTGAFTLLELVIALAIIAVLAAFALPSYRAQVARGHRTDAASALYRAAQYVESAPRSGGASTLPPGFDQAPQSGTPVYRLQMLAADDANGGYTLEATPIDTGPMRDDPCGTFTLDATGLRANRTASVKGDMSSADMAQCWSAR